MYTVAATLAMFVGFLIDRTRRRAAFMVVSLVIIAVTHATFVLGPNVPAEALMTSLGIAFALFAAAFWPSIAYATPTALFGTAYGFMGSVQNAGLALVPVLVGELSPPGCAAGGYSCVSWLFVGLSSVGCGVAVIAHRVERRAALQRGERGGGFAALCGRTVAGGDGRIDREGLELESSTAPLLLVEEDEKL